MDVNYLVYAAEPVDLDTRDCGARHGWRHALVEVAGSYNLYRPATAWRASVIDRRIELINRNALRAADAIVAHLPSGVETVGVPMEIEAATAQNKPAVVLTDRDSIALAGNDLIEVVRHSTEVIPALRRGLERYQTRIDTRARNVVEKIFHNPPDGHVKVVLQSVGREFTDGQNHPVRLPPSRTHDDDAGYDLYVVGNHIVGPGEFADLPSTVTGVQLPGWTWGMITGRSSTLRLKGLHVPVAVIDSGWRGPLFTGVWNLSKQPVEVVDGERLAQIIVMDNITMRVALQVVDQVDEHPRGLAGFGSSGA